MFNFSYSVPYLLLIGTYFLCAVLEVLYYNSSTTKRVIKYFGNVLFVVFFGFRGFIGWDWVSYVAFFNEVDIHYFFDFTIEPGFSLFSYMSKQIYDSYHSYIFINVVIDVILLNIFLNRYSYNFSFGVLLYVVFCFGIEVDNLRNVKSILLFMLSLKHLEDGCKVKYILLNVLGVLFHYSSLLYLPLCFFINKKMSKKLLILIFVIGNVLFITQFQYLSKLFLFIADLFGSGKITFAIVAYSNIDVHYGFSFGYIERCITILLLIIYYDKLLNRNNSNVLFSNIYVLYIIFFFYFGEFYILSTRFSGLFIFSYIIIWKELYKTIHKTWMKIIFLFFILCYSFAKMNGLTSSILYDYDNVLFYPKSYNERLHTFNAYSEDLIKT